MIGEAHWIRQCSTEVQTQKGEGLAQRLGLKTGEVLRTHQCSSGRSWVQTEKGES